MTGTVLGHANSHRIATPSTCCVCMVQWLKEDKINYLDDVTNGLENAPKAFIGMLHGENVGKAAVKVAEP